MQEAGTPVFIVVRCIAATRAAGTVYESINQSINQAVPGQAVPGQSRLQDKQSQDRVDSRKDLIRKAPYPEIT
jgi:hypothetical protein